MQISNFLYDLDHAKRYLKDTICKKGDCLYYIKDVEENYIEYKDTIEYIALTYKLPFNDKKIKILIDDTIEFNPSKLGYLNSLTKAIFCYRKPYRHWKLGLSLNSLSFDEERIFDIMYDENIIKSMLNIYPKELDFSNKISIAVNNKIKVDYKGNVFHSRNRKTSIGKLEDNTVILNKNYFYLSQMIEESGLKCIY